MSLSRRQFLQSSGAALGMAMFLGHLPAPLQAQSAPSSFSPQHHWLNRLTWGVRPADLARLNELGASAFLEEQLDYQNLADPVVEQFISGRRILSMRYAELQAYSGDPTPIILQTLEARLFRAVYSQRQLYERMVEFWTDHFNIPIPDYADVRMLDERDAIRPHALGTFRDLLFASAQSPAMLFYLNNASSDAEHPNENYARELLELHTLGVDGGYNEADVIDLARVLTGWTVRDGAFTFNPEKHDYGAKRVLGIDLPEGRGMEEGLQMLDVLARHPSTARFISFKLCRRFVSDVPPQDLVAQVAEVFSATEGDLKSVLRAIFASEAFAQAGGQKFRRPLEWLVAALRALSEGISIGNYRPLLEALDEMGQLPFHWHPPNGYPDVGMAWLNTNGLLHRWNVALALGLAGEAYLEGTALNLVPFGDVAGISAEDLLDTASQVLLSVRLEGEQRETLLAYLTDGQGDPALPLLEAVRPVKVAGLVGLLLASPVFQWH